MRRVGISKIDWDVGHSSESDPGEMTASWEWILQNAWVPLIDEFKSLPPSPRGHTPLPLVSRVQALLWGIGKQGRCQLLEEVKTSAIFM